MVRSSNKLSSELAYLTEEREHLERQKKIIRGKKKTITGGNGSDDSITKNDAEYQQKLDLKEESEILSFKIGLNQKAESQVQEKINALHKEKILFQAELNRK